MTTNSVDDRYYLAWSGSYDLMLQSEVEMQVFWAVQNLLDNAIKYAAGGGRLQVDMAGDRQRIRMRLRDFGPGIPAAHRERVFEKFHRVDASLTAERQGSGLGLSIALVRRYGLPGVAFATLVPVVLRAMTIVVPVACARVGLPVARFAVTAVWPTSSLSSATSSGVGLRPSLLKSSRVESLTLRIVSVMWTGTRIVRPLSARPLVIAWRIHHVA